MYERWRRWAVLLRVFYWTDTLSVDMLCQLRKSILPECFHDFATPWALNKLMYSRIHQMQVCVGHSLHLNLCNIRVYYINTTLVLFHKGNSEATQLSGGCPSLNIIAITWTAEQRFAYTWNYLVLIPSFISRPDYSKEELQHFPSYNMINASTV